MAFCSHFLLDFLLEYKKCKHGHGIHKRAIELLLLGEEERARRYRCKYLQSTLWEPARNCSRKIVVIVTFVGFFTGKVQRNCNCGSKLLKLKVILLQFTIHHRVIVLWERCTYMSTPRAALEDQATRRLY